MDRDQSAAEDREQSDVSECEQSGQHDGEDCKDYFQVIDGVRFAGRHLLVELWGASHLNDPDRIDHILTEAAVAAKATVLHSHFHHFSPYGGVSGVLVLAESHISIHTWPERDYAAIDLFMCGSCDPNNGMDALKRGFQADRVERQEIRRGILP